MTPKQTRLPTVLVVEDDEATRSVLVLTLSFQFDCMGVSSRDAALSLLRAGHRPSCVLMDYTMPGLDLKEFLQQAQPFNLKVVLMTAVPRARHEARSLGLHYVLEKPLLPDEIIDMLHNIVGGSEPASLLSASS
jgi:CheY-like chemotaxis protein